MGLLLSIFGNWKSVILLLVVMAGITVLLRFQFLENQHKADLATLAHTRQMLATAQAQARLNQASTNEADHTERVNTSTRTIVLQAQREITDAAQRQDAHAMYVAWSAGIERVWNDNGAARA